MASTLHADSLPSESPGKSRGRSPKWPLPWTTSVLSVEQAPRMVTSSRYVLRGCPGGLLSLWKQAGLIQDLYNCCLCNGSQSLLELPCPFQQWNVFCALGFKASPVGPQSQDILMIHLALDSFVEGLQSCKSMWGSNSHFLGRTFTILVTFLFVTCLPLNVGFEYSISLLLLPILLWFLLYTFSYGKIFYIRFQNNNCSIIYTFNVTEWGDEFRVF